MAQSVKHTHDEPHAVATTNAPVPQTTAADPPVQTIADEQRARSAVYEANLGQPETSKK